MAKIEVVPTPTCQFKQLQAKAVPGSSTGLLVTDSANMEPSSKHLFDMDVGVAEPPLAASATVNSTAASVKKWWAGLCVKNVEGLQNVQARADSVLALLS